MNRDVGHRAIVLSADPRHGFPAGRCDMTATLGLEVQAYGLMGTHGSLRQTPCGSLCRAMRCLYGHFVRDGGQEGHGEALHQSAVKSRMLGSDTFIEPTFAKT
jgi:hypothetical protein